MVPARTTFLILSSVSFAWGSSIEGAVKGSDAVAEMRRAGRQPSIGEVHVRGCEALQGSGDDIGLRRRHAVAANDGQQGTHHLSPAPVQHLDRRAARIGGAPTAAGRSGPARNPTAR